MNIENKYLSFNQNLSYLKISLKKFKSYIILKKEKA